MSQEVRKPKYVLRVGIYCDGCKKTVAKVLQKIKGVDKVNVDAEEWKVTVSGDVDPAILIQTLKKKGGQACRALGGWEARSLNNNKLELEDGKGEQEDNGKPEGAEAPLPQGQEEAAILA